MLSDISKRRQQMRIGKSVRIADELEKSIAEDPQFRPTSIYDLAAIHAVSNRTMWKAIQILIQCWRNQRRSTLLSHSIRCG
jgi:hypothetical protein